MSQSPNPTQNSNLVNVVSYANLGLVKIQNSYASLNLTNKRFKEFQKEPGQLGNLISFALNPRGQSSYGQEADFKGVAQRQVYLGVTQSANASFIFDDPQKIYNFDPKDFLQQVSSSYIAELGAKIEMDINQQFHSNVKFLSNAGNYAVTGNYQNDSGPYRFFGDGFTAIDSFTKLTQAYNLYKAVGAAPGKRYKAILPETVTPAIIDSGLSQFTLVRNNETANSWELGHFAGSQIDFYTSNLLPTHYAGTVGNKTAVADRTLTVVSTNAASNGGIVTQITCSGVVDVSDPDAIKRGDLASFVNTGSTSLDIVYLTQTGYVKSQAPVQFRVTADAASDGSGNVTFNIYPGLTNDITAGLNSADVQYVSNTIQAGQTIRFTGSHVCGIMFEEDAFLLGMPKLPDTLPFQGGSVMDDDSGASMRMYYGFVFGKGTHGIVHDQIWGSYLAPERCLRFLFPLNSVVTA